MTIDKLPSGKWRIRQQERGERFTITLDHKPTTAEAVQLVAARSRKAPIKGNQTFADAAAAYLGAKKNVLSPATRMGYNNILRVLPEQFKAARLTGITALDVQKVINDFAGVKAPKTVSNYSAFIMSVLKSAEVDIKPPQLPQKEKKEVYIPSEEDARRIFEAAAGTRFEVPFTLAALGLRRSEICALTVDDLDGNTLHITKALVPDENANYVIKGTKTTDSTRDIIIPEDIAEKIRQQGFIYQGCPRQLTRALYRIQKDLGMPRFSLHKLRHFFASYMHQKGYTNAQIQAAGGWKTDHVMKTVYQHAMDMDEAKQSMAADIGSLFQSGDTPTYQS